MLKHSRYIILFLLLCCLGIASATNVYADMCGGVDTSFLECNEGGVGGVTHIIMLVVNILSIGVAIAGFVVICIFGSRILSSKGESSKTSEAKKHLYETIIGLACYAVAWALLNWLLPGGDFTLSNIGGGTVSISFTEPLEVGKTIAPNITIGGDSKTTYTLRSSDPQIANIVGSYVKCLAVGTANITAISDSGGISETTVTCIEPVKEEPEGGDDEDYGGDDEDYDGDDEEEGEEYDENNNKNEEDFDEMASDLFAGGGETNTSEGGGDGNNDDEGEIAFDSQGASGGGSAGPTDGGSGTATPSRGGSPFDYDEELGYSDDEFNFSAQVLRDKEESVSWGEHIAQVAESMSWPITEKKSTYHHNYSEPTGLNSWKDLKKGKPNKTFKYAYDIVRPKHTFDTFSQIGADCGAFVTAVLRYSNHDSGGSKRMRWGQADDYYSKKKK